MGAGTCAAWRAARNGPPSRDAVLALVDGVVLTAAVGPLSGWPRTRTRTGLPWLADREGLDAELMKVYNPILYVSGGTWPL